MISLFSSISEDLTTWDWVILWLSFNHVTGKNYYFDLKNDPLEEHNLVDTLDEERLKNLIKFINYNNFEINRDSRK